MYRIIKILVFTFLIASIFSTCEEASSWELDIDNTPRLVVEAILTNENINQEIKLSQVFSELNGDTPYISNASIKVEANGVIYNFIADNTIPGLYKSEVPFAVVDNLIYTLNINWQNEEYTASSSLSTVAPMPTISFISINNSDSLAFGEFAPLYSTNQQSMYEMTVDWSHISNDSPNRAKTYFYTFSSIDISELDIPPREAIHFPKGSIVIAKKFGLNDEFAHYLRAKAIETNWRGKLFYANPENLPSNISNDGLGFFSTCAIISETLIAE